jgi:hypothetical protein
MVPGDVGVLSADTNFREREPEAFGDLHGRREHQTEFLQLRFRAHPPPPARFSPDLDDAILSSPAHRRKLQSLKCVEKLFGK